MVKDLDTRAYAEVEFSKKYYEKDNIASLSYIKDPEIAEVYRQDIVGRKTRNKKGMTPLEPPLAYNAYGKIVRAFGERRGMYHKNLKSV